MFSLRGWPDGPDPERPYAPLNSARYLWLSLLLRLDQVHPCRGRQFLNPVVLALLRKTGDGFRAILLCPWYGRADCAFRPWTLRGRGLLASACRAGAGRHCCPWRSRQPVPAGHVTGCASLDRGRSRPDEAACFSSHRAGLGIADAGPVFNRASSRASANPSEPDPAWAAPQAAIRRPADRGEAAGPGRRAVLEGLAAFLASGRPAA